MLVVSIFSFSKNVFPFTESLYSIDVPSAVVFKIDNSIFLLVCSGGGSE